MVAQVDIITKGFQCERCKHKWAPRMKGEPIICPKCKSPYWNREKKKK